MALWDDDDNDQNQDDNQPATTGAGSPASAIGGLPMPSAPPVAPGVQPQGGGLGKYIPAALKGGLSGAGMGQPGMGPNGGAYGPTMGMQGGGMGAPRQSPGQMSMGLAQGGGKALGIGINQLIGRTPNGGAPAVPSTGIPAGGYPGMATGAGPVAPTVGAAPAAAATDPLADAADATFANGGTVMGPRRYPALANGAMIQPSGGNGAGGWGQPQSMTRQPQWGNGQQQGPQQQGPQQQGPQQWGGGPPMPSQMGGNPYNGVGYQPRMNMQSGGIPQQGGMPMQGQQMPQQMPVGTRPQPQGGYPGMGGTPAPQQGGGGFPMGQMQQGARPFSGGGWGGVGGGGPMAMGPAQQPQGGMPYAMANGGTVTGGGTSTAPGGSGSNPATNTFEWPPAKPGSSQLGTPALARGGVVLGPPEPPSMTAPGGTTYQQPGMVQRRYSPVNPIGPHVSFGPRPEDMGNHLPTRLPIGHRMSVRMPRPKVGGTGVGGAGKI